MSKPRQNSPLLGPLQLFDSNSDFLFLDSKREHLVNLLRHLSVNTDLWLVIEGPSGCGKTFLLDQIKVEFEEKLIPTFYLSVGMASDHNVFTGLLNKGLVNLTGPAQGDQLSAGQQAIFQDQHGYLLLDDAEALPAEALEKIRHFQLVSPVSLKVILAGQPGTEDRIKQLLGQSQFPAETHGLLLEPFDRKAMQEYIESAFLQAGDELGSPFSEEQLDTLYRKSTGVPILVNQEVFAELENMLSGGKKRKTAGVVSALSLLALMLFVAFKVEFSEKSLPQKEVDLLLPGAKFGATHTELEIQPGQGARLMAAGAQLAKPKKSVQPQPEEVTQTEEQVPESFPLKLTSLPAAYLELMLTPGEKSAANFSLASKGKVETETRGGIHREEWILAQEDGLSTLQLLLHSDEAVIRNFVSANSLDGAAAYYKKKLGGETYYCLIYGLFTSIEETARVRDKLTPSVAQFKPWRRSIAAVKKDILEQRSN